MSKTKSFLLALLIIMGLIFLNFPGISDRIKNSFYSISYPIQKKIDKFFKQIKNSWDFLNSLEEISKDNLNLEKTVKELVAQNIKLKELEKENEFLRSRLNLPKDQKYQVELADVIGRDFQGLEKYILINKGSSSGINKNMPVVAYDNILMGKIVEVYENFSKILLITSSNSKIPALIQESRVDGLIKGTSGNLLLLDLVPKDRDVEKNKTVITSGIEGVFPKGLLIGKISNIESSDKEMFLKIEVVPDIEMSKLEKVFVIKSK